MKKEVITHGTSKLSEECYTCPECDARGEFERVRATDCYEFYCGACRCEWRVCVPWEVK